MVSKHLCRFNIIPTRTTLPYFVHNTTVTSALIFVVTYPIIDTSFYERLHTLLCRRITRNPDELNLKFPSHHHNCVVNAFDFAQSLVQIAKSRLISSKTIFPALQTIVTWPTVHPLTGIII